MSGKQAKKKRKHVNDWMITVKDKGFICPYCGQSICDDDSADIVIMNNEALNIIRNNWGLKCLEN